MFQERVISEAVRARFAPAETGEARWWLGCLAIIKVKSAETGGAYAIIDVHDAPGSEAPLHVHHREDESFWILEGDAVFEVGNEIFTARTGDFIFAPRDVPHRYTAGAKGCRILFFVTPGGFEEMIIEMSEPAGERSIPPPATKDPDWDALFAVAKAHGIDVLG